MMMYSVPRLLPVRSGFLAGLLLLLFQLSPSPALAESSDAVLADGTLPIESTSRCTSPQEPGPDDDILNKRREVDDDDSSPGKSASPYLAIARRPSQPINPVDAGNYLLAAPVTRNNAFRITPIFLLTERFRL